MAALDLGEAGPHEGKPVVFHWSLWLHFLPLLPWVALVALLFRRANRNPHAWLALVPVMVLTAPLVLLGFLFSLLEEEQAAMGAMVDFLGVRGGPALAVVSVGVLLLVADRIGTLRRVPALMVSACVLGGMSLLAAWGCGWPWLSPGVLVTCALLCAPLVVGLAAATLACRRSYSPLKFLLGLYLAGAGGVGAFIACLGLVSVLAVYASGPEPAFAMMMAAAMLVYAIFGAVLYAGMLTPFVLVVFLSGFWRERVLGACRLSPPRPHPEPVPTTPVGPDPVGADGG